MNSVPLCVFQLDEGLSILTDPLGGKLGEARVWRTGDESRAEMFELWTSPSDFETRTMVRIHWSARFDTVQGHQRLQLALAGELPSDVQWYQLSLCEQQEGKPDLSETIEGYTRRISVKKKGHAVRTIGYVFTEGTGDQRVDHFFLRKYDAPTEPKEYIQLAQFPDGPVDGEGFMELVDNEGDLERYLRVGYTWLKAKAPGAVEIPAAGGPGSTPEVPASSPRGRLLLDNCFRQIDEGLSILRRTDTNAAIGAVRVWKAGGSRAEFFELETEVLHYEGAPGVLVEWQEKLTPEQGIERLALALQGKLPNVKWHHLTVAKGAAFGKLQANLNGKTLQVFLKKNPKPPAAAPPPIPIGFLFRQSFDDRRVDHFVLEPFDAPCEYGEYFELIAYAGGVETSTDFNALVEQESPKATVYFKVDYTWVKVP